MKNLKRLIGEILCGQSGQSIEITSQFLKLLPTSSKVLLFILVKKNFFHGNRVSVEAWTLALMVPVFIFLLGLELQDNK